MVGENFTPNPNGSLEGLVFRPASSSELSAVLSQAINYRGDVTIRLSSGASITGYIYDRHESVTTPSIRIFVENVEEPQVALYEDIVEVAFTGEDTAFGKSWEDWAKKWKKGSERIDP